MGYLSQILSRCAHAMIWAAAWTLNVCRCLQAHTDIQGILKWRWRLVGRDYRNISRLLLIFNIRRLTGWEWFRGWISGSSIRGGNPRVGSSHSRTTYSRSPLRCVYYPMDHQSRGCFRFRVYEFCMRFPSTSVLEWIILFSCSVWFYSVSGGGRGCT